MSDNLRIWSALEKTDPAQTKGFNRAGGFKGTAVKPIWITKRLTEQFGPCGEGWGVNEPHFQVVPAGEEILVYCTVSVWHGERANIIYGVGGDKVLTKRSSGPFADDEAFKKSFTDAIGNAVKQLGVAADVHMGLFDDDKYVEQARRDFAAIATITDDQRDIIAGLAESAGVTLMKICETAKIAALPELPAAKFDSVVSKLNLTIASKKQKEPA